MNTKYLKIFIFTFSLLLVFGVTLSAGAINNCVKTAKIVPAKPQEILYRVSSSDLESLKNSLAQINLHMREGTGRAKPEIKIVIHGSGAKFFYQEGIDSELKYMLDWFLTENVRFGVCKICQETFGINMNALSKGFAKVESQ